jgi:phage terminase large subunit
MIDFMEISGEGLPSIVKRLDKLPYAFAEHFLPHDAEARELGTGETRRETLQKLMGSKQRLTVLPAQNVEDGIHSARMIFSRCYFDADNTGKLIQSLKKYRRQMHQSTGAFGAPLHDDASHDADAFRYLAVGESGLSNGDRGFAPIQYRNRVIA